VSRRRGRPHPYDTATLESAERIHCPRNGVFRTDAVPRRRDLTLFVDEKRERTIPMYCGRTSTSHPRRRTPRPRRDLRRPAAEAERVLGVELLLRGRLVGTDATTSTPCLPKSRRASRTLQDWVVHPACPLWGRNRSRACGLVIAERVDRARLIGKREGRGFSPGFRAPWECSSPQQPCLWRVVLVVGLLGADWSSWMSSLTPHRSRSWREVALDLGRLAAACKKPAHTTLGAVVASAWLK